MKHLPLIAALSLSLFASGCASMRFWEHGTAQEQAAAPVKPKAADGITVQDADGTAVVQKVEFRSGVSSATVERLAKRFGCTGERGAGLVTEKGPVEVYRMQCDNGTTFMAQCELRQCRPMR